MDLPDPSNLDGDRAHARAVPADHPPMDGSAGVSCPFALIQAALESNPSLGVTAPALNSVSPKVPATPKAKAAPIVFHKHELFDTAIPEGISMKEKALEEGLNTNALGEEDGDSDDGNEGVEMSHRPKGALMCPVSGIMTDAPGSAPPPPMLAQPSFKAPPPPASAAPSGSRGGSKGSRRSGSHASSSRRKKNANRVKRRTKRNITFSEWEADTYIPQIKYSWGLLLAVHTRSEIGTAFYTNFLDRSQELSHMFTSGVEALGPKFGEILDSIVASTDNPASMHEQLKALAPMHIKKGVKAEYLPGFGGTLIDTIGGILGDQFTNEMRAAWEWLWTWISQSFIMSLEEASNEATILGQSWDMAMDNCPGNEFGEMFFDVLFELAPNMNQLFNKPKQILSVKFMEMISTLVSFNNDPVRLTQQSIWLGMRHVKYGARAQHQAVIGQVVITTLERAVGEEWTAEMDKAWSDLWAMACRSMLDVTSSADKHGEVVRKMWADTRARTTCAKFGTNLRKMLLSGTEWVQGLSQGMDATKPMDKEGIASPRKKKPTAVGADGGVAGPDDASVASSQQVKGGHGGGSTTHESVTGHSAKEKEALKEDSTKAQSDADAVGSHFWEMLNILMDYLWEPEQMNERLVVMTKSFFELGVRQVHLETIGNAICFSMERVLADAWQPIMKESWQWFWKMISEAMAAALDVLESGDVELIRDGWEEAKASRPAEELGDIFFKELARIAPHVTHLFKRPKRIQALQFINVVEMLLCFNEDPEQFFIDLKPLTIRHIKYGVKADYARAFGMTVLNGISQVLGDKFDDRNKKAWGRLWTRVSSCVTRALNVGSNLVIVSLVQDDIENFIDAMDCVPRGERFETLTKIDVNGESVSPLDWSIMGGQVVIAKWVIEDLLAVRADRNTYYYGRETMFGTHPGLVSKICKHMPHLVENVLDGLMWHASMVVDSRVRVNYYVREMYGVPSETADTWSSTLGELVQHGAPELFNHPVIETLLRMKWWRFGLRLYISIQAWYTLMLALFTYGFAQLSDECTPVATSIRQAVGCMAAVTLVVQTAVVGGQLYRGQVSQFHVGRMKFRFPRFLINPWNAARFVSSMMLIVVAFSEQCQEGVFPEEEGLSWHRVVVASTSLFMWVQFMQVLVLSNKLAAFVYSVGRLSTDIAINFTIILVMIIAFGTCLNILKQPGGYDDDIGTAMLNIVRVVAGLGEPEHINLHGWGLAALLMVIIMIAICLINILVAQLVSSYGVLATNAEGFAKMNRAYICVEMESMLTMKYRLRCFDECGFDSPLEFDSSDEGPSGGIQVLAASSIRTHAKYVPDRVVRFTGDASPMDPWPTNKVEEEEELGILQTDAPAVD